MFFAALGSFWAEIRHFSKYHELKSYSFSLDENNADSIFSDSWLETGLPSVRSDPTTPLTPPPPAEIWRRKQVVWTKRREERQRGEVELLLKQMWLKRKERRLLSSWQAACQISPAAPMIFSPLFDILPSPGLPSLFV